MIIMNNNNSNKKKHRNVAELFRYIKYKNKIQFDIGDASESDDGDIGLISPGDKFDFGVDGDV